MEPILEAKSLNLWYGPNHALHDVSVAIPERQITAFIGPSGCGKSTFLRCLNLLETPTTGEIVYHGTNIADKKVNAPQYRSRVGMVFQSFNLIDELNVYEIV